MDMKDQKIKDRPSSLPIIYWNDRAFEDRSPNSLKETVLLALKIFV